MKQQRAFHSLRLLCCVLNVSPSGYYGWCDRRESRRERANRELLEQVRVIHEASHRRYGAVKVWKALRAQGIACGKHRVARLRRVHGIEAARRRRFKVTTRSKDTTWIAPNRLERNFTVREPNRIWVGDVTFIATCGGWLYLAVLLDLYSRKVIGWSMSQRNDQQLVLHALQMALRHRQPKMEVVHHTDRGASYAAEAYRKCLSENRLLSSMSRRGDCYDNAVAESFFSTLKNELIYGKRYVSRDAARCDVFEYIEVFYNRQRSHQSLNYRTPDEFERMALSPNKTVR